MGSGVYESVELNDGVYLSPTNTESFASKNTITRYLDGIKLPGPVMSKKIQTGGCPKLRFGFIVLTCLLAVAILALVVINFIRRTIEEGGISGYSRETEVTVFSDGCCNFNKTEHLHSLFYIDNTPVCPTWGERERGFNFAVLKLPPYGRPRLESCKTFDTYFESNAGVRMGNFMQIIPAGRLILVSVFDSASMKDRPNNYFNLASRTMMKIFNPLSGNIDKLGYRDSFALVGYKGNCTPSWVTDQRAHYDSGTQDGKFIRLNVKIPASWKCG